MPFVQRVIEPKYLSRTKLFDDEGKPRVTDNELTAVTNNTLANALKQLASLVLVANDIFVELGNQLQEINKRSSDVKVKIRKIEDRVNSFDPKKVTVPEGDICTFALRKDHYASKINQDTNLFSVETRPAALQALYESATKTPVHLMRQLDRWRRDGHRSSRFFLCTPVLDARKRKFKTKVDIDIETGMPEALKDLRRWTSSEALGDITVAPDCPNRIASNITATVTDGVDAGNGTVTSDDEAIDHKLPSPEEQLQVVALKFPAEIVAVDISGRSFARMSVQRRSLHNEDSNARTDGGTTDTFRRSRTRKPRNKRRNTLAGTDQKEIRDALTTGNEPSSPINTEAAVASSSTVSRSKSSDFLRRSPKLKDSPEIKKSHFNSLKQWGKNTYDKFMNKSGESNNKKETAIIDIDDTNIYETVTSKRKRSVEKERKKSHERTASISSSEKSSMNIPITPLTSVMNVAVKLRDSSAQRRRRSGGTKDEPHSSSGNWSASSESRRNSLASESTTTTHPKSTTSNATSNNSLNVPAPSSVNSRRRFNINNSTSGSCTSEGTLTPDIIHDLHEDGETSSIYSCDTEGYYTSFHMDSGLKTLKEEEMPPTPLHSTSEFSNSSSNNTVMTAENEYELFGKGSTSTTTSSAGTVCTTLRAGGSNKSLIIGPTVPERKSSLNKFSNSQDKSTDNSPTDCDFSEKTGTVKRSPITHKAMVHKQHTGDVSPDSGHNTSSSPIESINSPNGVRSGSEFEFSESSDMEGPERIERIRVKTTINSSRIPSMCVITPQNSDDDSDSSSNTNNNNNSNRNKETDKKSNDRSKLFLPLKALETDSNALNFNPNNNNNTKMQVINVNPQTGYATIESNEPANENLKNCNIPINNNVQKSRRSPSPSGGSLIIPSEEEHTKTKSVLTQPIFKATLLPLNSMLGKLKTNLVNLKHSGENKSQVKHLDETDSGEYITIADVKNNNEKMVGKSKPIKEDVTYANNIVSTNLKTILSGKLKETEYISLNELPCNETQINSSSTNNNNTTIDSLERKKRQGARVTLDAEGKVVYSSDSLRRQKGAHTTFEPGPFVKPSNSPTQSPLPIHRTPKVIRPVNNNNHENKFIPIKESNSKFVISAKSPTPEIVRIPPSMVVAPNSRPMSPKSRGAYVHVQDTSGRSLSPAQEKEQIPPFLNLQGYYNAPTEQRSLHSPFAKADMYNYQNENRRDYLESQYYFQKGNTTYQTMPDKRSQYLSDLNPERSVTPDITRGLERNYSNSGSIDRRRILPPQPQQTPIYRYNYTKDQNLLKQRLGVPVQVPQVGPLPTQNQNVPFYNPYNYNTIGILPQTEKPSYSPSSNYISPYASQYTSIPEHNESIRISPIDPRSSGEFKSSTPSNKNNQPIKAAINLEQKLLSPKKSTMTNEELYAVIHKSKKKMNIETDETLNKTPSPPVTLERNKLQTNKPPESGYLGNKSQSRLSWSPSKGEYTDFNSDIDKLSPPRSQESRSRQSWACNDRKGTQQTSRLDFKKLLLQKSNNVLPGMTSKKLSAVEQLKLSKEQKDSKLSQQSEMNILELSGSPRSLVNRKFAREGPIVTTPKNTPDKVRTPPKLMSPKSQWRFANPRTDVLSSTILEDCGEDDSPNSSIEKKKASPKNQSPNNQSRVENKFTYENKSNYMSATQRLQAQRAQFLNSGSPSNNSQFNNKSDSKYSRVQRDDKKNHPTLETAF